MIVATVVAGVPLRVMRDVEILNSNPLVKAVLGEDLVTQVPLAMIGGSILFSYIGWKQLWQAFAVWVQWGIVHYRPGSSRIQPCHNAGPAGGTDGACDVAFVKDIALLSQCVDIGHDHGIVAVSGKSVSSLFVGEDK